MAWAARCSLLASGQLRGLLARLGRAEFLGGEIRRQGHLRVNDELLGAGQLHHEVGPEAAVRACAVALPAVDLLVEIDVAEHACCLDHPAELDLTPLAAGAVGAQGRFERMRGAQQLLVGQPGLLQLLGELAVLLQPVALQQRHLLLHGRELFRHRGQRPQHTAVLVPGLAELPVLGREQAPFGVGGGELGADFGEPGRYAVEVVFHGDVPPAEQDIDDGGARNGANEQHEQGKNHSKSIHGFTLACPCDSFGFDARQARGRCMEEARNSPHSDPDPGPNRPPPGTAGLCG